MRILFFTDDYTWNIYGTKRSTAEALVEAGHDLVIKHVGRVDEILAFVEKHRPDQVWQFHSDLRLPKTLKKGVGIPVIGFGISDPYYFSEDRFSSYDVYVTYHHATYEKYKCVIPCVYNATACDFKFHKNLGLSKTVDISVIGAGEHARFHDKTIRVKFVEALRRDLSRAVHTYGRSWPEHPHHHGFVDGADFLEAINRSVLGLDLQDDWSPLAHRMFEYAACGVPVITRRRDEVFMYFSEDSEILVYDDYKDLREKIVEGFADPDRLKAIGRSARQRCKRQHDIALRVERLLQNLSSIIG